MNEFCECHLVPQEPTRDWKERFEEAWHISGSNPKTAVLAFIEKEIEKAREDAWNTMVNIESVPEEIIKQLREQGYQAGIQACIEVAESLKGKQWAAPDWDDCLKEFTTALKSY